MKLILALIFILWVIMVRCDFCGTSFGDRGIRTHVKKCPARIQQLQTSAAQAVALEQARIDPEAAAASASLATAQQMENLVDEIWHRRFPKFHARHGHCPLTPMVDLAVAPGFLRDIGMIHPSRQPPSYSQ
ncbi:hypothetical protein DFH09DRAFT_1270314 [Mycena vulgaris]|nr:hypothetical protein DFH09DRAFT_1270314 [Mycena vulgaris]